MRFYSLTLLLSLLMLSACSTVSGLWPFSTASADIAASQGGAAQPAAVTSKAITGSAIGSIDIQWRANIDQRQPASPSGFSLPGVIKTAQGEVIIVGAQDRRVRIYSSAGSELGRISLGSACESGALQLSNGTVVVGDVRGVLYGLDINTATIIWKQQLSAALMNKPVAVGDDFIVQTSNNQLYRFHADGSKVWSYTAMIGGLGMHLQPSPVIYGKHVYAIFNNADLVALNLEGGSFVWKRQLLISNNAAVMSEMKVPLATPLVITAAASGRHEDVLLASVFQSDLSFLSLRDGSTLSARKISLKSAPLLLGKQLFVADASGAVSALNASNGDTLWKQQVSHGELTGPALWHGDLWVADDHGHVFRLNQQGQLLASKQLSGRIDRQPVAAANGVLVRNSLGTLYMLR